jgi:hypothetical protein
MVRTMFAIYALKLVKNARLMDAKNASLHFYYRVQNVKINVMMAFLKKVRFVIIVHKIVKNVIKINVFNALIIIS